MGNMKQRGFTIIELILFLGITGALFAALMLGVNTSIYQQRYKDSVMAYKSLLEQQYAEVTYPRNERDDKWTCTSESGVQQQPNGGEARGTSNCVLLGRYVQIKNNGSVVETGNVVGFQPADTTLLAGDIATLAAYTPRLSPLGKQDHEVEWQSILKSTEDQPSAASFLVLRSPLSGLIRTFALAEPLPANLNMALTEAAATAKIKNCVVQSGNIGMPLQSVTVSAVIGSANGVTIQGSDEEC